MTTLNTLAPSPPLTSGLSSPLSPPSFHHLSSTSSFGSYISPRGLEYLKHYKYVSGLSGYLDRVIMTPFWNWVVELMPMWIAPNTITVISLANAFITHGMIQYYSPHFTEKAPQIVYILCAFFMFLYQTFDAVDGKQARRTQSSSPLGQLFDHGCDAICAVLTGIFMAATVSFGPTVQTFACYLVIVVPFFVSNWEESCTGVMRFGIVGVTEGQFTVMGALVLTGLLGPHIWEIPFVSNSSLEFLTLRTVFLTIGLSGGVYQVISSVLSVTNYCSAHHQSPVPYFLQLIQFIFMLVVSFVWVIAPTNLYVTYPRVLLLNSGLMMCYMVSRLIVAHHTRDYYPVPFYWVVLYPLIVANSWFNNAGGALLGLTEEHIMWGWFAFILVIYLHFITVAINQITASLGISCFVIKKRA